MIAQNAPAFLYTCALPDDKYDISIDDLIALLLLLKRTNFKFPGVKKETTEAPALQRYSYLKGEKKTPTCYMS